MNIFLWVLQVLLSAWTITGATYMAGNYEFLVTPEALALMPAATWGIIATLQIVLALALVLPGLFRTLPNMTSYSAIGLAVLYLLGLFFYIAYAGLAGSVWAIIPALILLFIAYKRWPR